MVESECASECGTPSNQGFFRRLFTPQIDLNDAIRTLNLVELVGPLDKDGFDPNECPASVSGEAVFDCEKVTLVYVVRRLGCPLCRGPIIDFVREENNKSLRDVRIVVISSQKENWEDFLTVCFFDNNFTDVSLYIDAEEKIKKEVFGGKPWKPIWLLKLSVLRSMMVYKDVPRKSNDMTDKTNLLGGEIIVRDKNVNFARREGRDFSHTPSKELNKFLSM